MYRGARGFFVYSSKEIPVCAPKYNHFSLAEVLTWVQFIYPEVNRPINTKFIHLLPSLSSKHLIDYTDSVIYHSDIVKPNTVGSNVPVKA